MVGLGMPICAAAEKLRREIELYGVPQQLPEDVKADLIKKGKESQYNIMAQMGITDDIIRRFEKPEEWCFYFPPIGRDDLKKFGCYIDFDRSFITTSINPYYDSFIRWQFNTLKERGYLKFGRRYIGSYAGHQSTRQKTSKCVRITIAPKVKASCHKSTL